MSNGHQLLRNGSNYAYSAPSFHFQLGTSLSYYSAFLGLAPPSAGCQRSTEIVAALPQSTAWPDLSQSTSAKSLSQVLLTAPSSVGICGGLPCAMLYMIAHSLSSVLHGRRPVDISRQWTSLPGLLSRPRQAFCSGLSR